MGKGQKMNFSIFIHMPQASFENLGGTSENKYHHLNLEDSFWGQKGGYKPPIEPAFL